MREKKLTAQLVTLSETIFFMSMSSARNRIFDAFSVGVSLYREPRVARPKRRLPQRIEFVAFSDKKFSRVNAQL
jgi:hypothetical protein